MKYTGMLMNTEMVRATLEERKTHTRRPVKVPKPWLTQCKWYLPHPGGGWHGHDGDTPDAVPPGAERGFPCPYGEVGDRIWVRETWLEIEKGTFGRSKKEIVYRATDEEAMNRIYKKEFIKWRPSIHMPRWASRITLEIVSIRIQRVQDVTEEEAKEEGVDFLFTQNEINTTVGLIGTSIEEHGYKNYLWHGYIGKGITPKQSDLWDYQYSSYIDAKGSFSSLWQSIYGDWQSNPWAWDIGYKVVEQ